MISKNIEISTPIVIEKGWGREVIFANEIDGDYCGKILEFHEGAEFSFHYHMSKKESWLVTRGWFQLTYFDLETGEEKQIDFTNGDCTTIDRGKPHKLKCVSQDGGAIFEVSTYDMTHDSYRIGKGDSQK